MESHHVVDVHIHFDNSNENKATLAALTEMARAVLRNTQQLLKGQQIMALDLTELTTAVSKGTTVTDSVLALIQQLASVQDPTALAALVAQMNADSDRVAAAVVANTPAVIPPPAV